MPSFDIVSEVNDHELQNAVDQANREVTTRFDFKGTDSKLEIEKEKVTISSASKFQVEQIREILKNRLTKRGIDLRCLKYSDVEESLNHASMVVTVQQGIDKDAAKKIQKIIKETKIKVQSSVQGEQIRVTGKKRDDLQSIISTLKDKDLELALQFTNFRD